jgi:hypothetical protein
VSPSLAERVRPVTLAGEQLLPVDEALTSALALPGLVRGTTVAVTGPAVATSLAVALVARAAAGGSWVVSVGQASLGLAAAEGLGLPLERLVMVAPPEPTRWASVLAAVVEGFDVVLAGAPARVRPADARRLVARLRERRSVLVQVGWPTACWPEEPELSMHCREVHWEGIGWGWGHCRARRVEVELSGRRGAGRPRRGWLWLPDADGRLTAAAPPGEPDARPVAEPLDAVGEAVAAGTGGPAAAGTGGPAAVGPVGPAGAAGAGPTVVVPERPRLNLVPPPPARRRRRPAAASRGRSS